LDSEPGKPKARQGNRNNKKGPKQHKYGKNRNKNSGTKHQPCEPIELVEPPHETLHGTKCPYTWCPFHREEKLNHHPARPEKVPHNSLHWTACYDDSCLVHKDGKDNGYYLRTPKKELGRRTGPSALTNRQIVELEEAKEDNDPEEDTTQLPDETPDRQPSEPDWDWEKHDIEENYKELRNKVNEIANDIDRQLHKTTEVLEELDERMGNRLTPPRSATQGIDDIPVRA
ncbi:hypothetical protein S40285_10862, partial [Stachybotrys chlorohalonatus IBT 40285]